MADVIKILQKDKRIEARIGFSKARSAFAEKPDWAYSRTAFVLHYLNAVLHILSQIEQQFFCIYVFFGLFSPSIYRHNIQKW